MGEKGGCSRVKINVCIVRKVIFLVNVECESAERRPVVQRSSGIKGKEKK